MFLITDGISFKKMLLTAILALISTPVLSIEWQFSPSLLIGAVYTDNVTLESLGNEESDFIAQINPGFTLIGVGNRFNLNMDYVMENLYYREDSNRNNRYHRLRMFNSNELIEDLFHLDLGATNSQDIVSPRGRVPVANISVVGNRTNVLTYNISPYFTFVSGDDFISEIRYQYIKNDYDNEILTGAFDNKADIYTVSMGTNNTSNKFIWNLFYSDRTIEYDDTDQTTNELANIELDTGTAINNSLRTLIAVGYDDNNYERAADTEVPKGAYWNAGLLWVPSTRTSAEIRVGERYFGPTRALMVTHTSRRTTFSLELSEQIETIATARRTAIPGDVTGTEPPSEIFDPNAVTLTTDVFLQERFEATMEYAGNRSTMNFSLYKLENDFQTSDRVEDVIGVDLILARRLSRNNTIEYIGGYQERTFLPENREDKITSHGLKLINQISRYLTGNIEFRSLKRKSTAATSSYEENLVLISLEYIYR